ncbi:hypothetical protein JW979_06050 [bacterium]|nr:hypothetical protein [candidate division CSSED10-310 bacterium]
MTRFHTIFFILACLFISQRVWMQAEPDKILNSAWMEAESALNSAGNAVKLGSTHIRDLSPEYWIEMPAIGSWDDALDYTAETYKDDPLKTGLCLWRFLYPTQPAGVVNSLKPVFVRWKEKGKTTQQIGLVLLENHPESSGITLYRDEPYLSVETWIEGTQFIWDEGKKSRHMDIGNADIVGPTMMVFTGVQVKNVVYQRLVFDANGYLQSFTVILPWRDISKRFWIRGNMNSKITGKPYFITVTDLQDKPFQQRIYDETFQMIESTDRVLKVPYPLP